MKNVTKVVYCDSDRGFQGPGLGDYQLASLVIPMSFLPPLARCFMPLPIGACNRKGSCEGE